MVQLPECNKNYIKQLMHFKVPCLGIMEDLTDIVHRALDGTDPHWGVWFIYLHGLRGHRDLS
jgi:hypothetical protein